MQPMVMDRSAQPATDIQLRRLQQLGYNSYQPLTREEAVRLIREMETVHCSSRAFDLNRKLESTKLALAGALAEEEPKLRAELEQLRIQRREYWLNSCREPGQMSDVSTQVLELYMKYGCRFTAPSIEQVQVTLDALDSAMPGWDENHQELFYSTLELNFPELLRRA
jgi:hypothetical protein